MKFLKSNKPSKTIFLHIGVPKTGSSTLQKGLFQNIDVLQEFGFGYPQNGLLGTNHKNIFFELTSMPDHRSKFTPAAGNLDQLVKEITDSKLKKFIISAEHFALFSESEVFNLKSKLPQVSIKVVVYLRRQDQVIQSGWSQNTKRLVTNKSLDLIVSEELSTNQSVYHYDYLLEKWAAAFGKDNLIIRIFEPKKLAGHIFHDFIETCGIKEFDQFGIPDSSNVSPGYKTIGLIQEISKRLDLNHIDPLTRVEIGRQIELFCNQLGWGKDKKFNGIDKKTFTTVMEHFSPGNQKVAKYYLGIPELFSSTFSEKEITNFDLSQIDPQHLADIFSHILNSFTISLPDDGPPKHLLE